MLMASDSFFVDNSPKPKNKIKQMLKTCNLMFCRYWIPGEPNNYGPSTGEDCAAFVNIKHPRQTWFDASCSEQMDWLCEAEPQM